MRFGRCSNCGEYKHLISDAECNSCSDEEVRGTMEVPEIPDHMKKFMPEDELESKRMTFNGSVWYAQDVIYSEIRERWLLEIYDGEREFLTAENVKKYAELIEGGKS